MTEERGASVFERGVCWSTSEGPTVEDQYASSGYGIGTYSVVVTNLECETLYYVRAYARNANGVGYGEQKSFTTGECPAELPTVTTAAIAGITQTGAQGAGRDRTTGAGM
ncbi:MAG: hypothetical protein R2751_09975 [Bacteroidales bacterium]